MPLAGTLPARPRGRRFIGAMTQIQAPTNPSTTPGRVADRVVIVTGGARGIGAACVRALVAEGARVVVADVLEAEASALVAALGERTAYVPLDVTSEEAWQHAVAAAEERFGPVSGLVNNAGIVHIDPIETLSEADYRRVIDVNQVGVFLGMKAVIGSMRRAGGGSIVNISSTGGLVAYSRILGYVASKWAVRGMTKTAAQELGPDGIRVNSVHPGIVASAMTASSDRSHEQVRTQPLARAADPSEIGALVLFLISEESSYSTGSEFVADGGFTSL
ncbi:20-beta-hydroxysteroid dehydrogenase FabG3 [Pimelobacter simplex]|uniref:20-beta-hydroxysteroid dehydrogenase fabG3 n=2 Tax=Nocardioides simplex TaxID=2045 RepID=A0A0A1DU45_NOCSI|nr:20-beta-hydroxysteroid dehydrogenase FabG3 [Pimelobacter simplex]GEB14676.1 dehydrogenase [Pimelobacter simplex]SFM26914.1 3alpha(or 20beta)-hydroxysteroid dehydrogenase [Pimelobacter simplex]